MTKEAGKETKTLEPVEQKGKAVQRQETKRNQKIPQESAYSVNELSANAKTVFGVRQECVMAALKAAGKTECTVTEAKGILEKFMKREVR